MNAQYDNGALRYCRAKSNRARRALKKFEPKIFENPKSCLFLKGNKTSDLVNHVMTDLV